MTTFRKEVFNICKKIQTMEKSLDIATVIKDLTISSENLNTGEIKERKHGDFAYVAKHSNNQFHGYLFVDENIDEPEISQLTDVNLPVFTSITPKFKLSVKSK